MWEVLVWRDGDWKPAGWGRDDLQEAFDFMKEVNAHLTTGPENPEMFWDIRCRAR